MKNEDTLKNIDNVNEFPEIKIEYINDVINNKVNIVFSTLLYNNKISTQFSVDVYLIQNKNYCIIIDDMAEKTKIKMYSLILECRFTVIALLMNNILS